jgi:hypothetical protein
LFCLLQRRVEVAEAQAAGYRTALEREREQGAKLGQLQPFLAAFPQECMGQLASFGPPDPLLAEGSEKELLQQEAGSVAEMQRLMAALRARCEQGSVVLPLCTAAHPLHTRIANIFDASLSKATMRPNPRCEQNDAALEAERLARAALEGEKRGLETLLADWPARAAAEVAVQEAAAEAVVVSRLATPQAELERISNGLRRMVADDGATTAVAAGGAPAPKPPPTPPPAGRGRGRRVVSEAEDGVPFSVDTTAAPVKKLVRQQTVRAHPGRLSALSALHS